MYAFFPCPKLHRSAATRSGVTLASLLVAATIFPCAVPAQTGSVTTARKDSAGVAIFESTVHDVRPVAPILVDTTPLLRITSAGSTPATESALRVSSARVLRSGAIVIGDSAARLHFYTRYGVFQKSVGGLSDAQPAAAAARGSAPAAQTASVRFSSMRRVDSRADTAIACCTPGIARFSAAGNLILESAPFRGDFLGVLQNGRYLVRRTTDETRAYQGQKGVVKSLLNDSLFTVDSRGNFGARIAVLPSRIHVSVFNPDPNPLGFTIAFVESPFEPESFYAVTTDGFAYTDGTRMEVRIFNPAGRLLRILRIAGQPSAITAAMADAYRQAVPRKYANPETRRYIEWVLAQYQVPRTLPAVRGLVVAADRRIWVREHVFPAAATARWHVFAPQGAYEGVVTLPSRFTPLQIESDVMVVRETTESGQAVSLHRIGPRP